MNKKEVLANETNERKGKIFEKMDKMMKAMTKSVEEMVSLLGEKYGFDKAEALEFIMPGGEITRGRPSKPKKKVVNKTEMVEDVIKTIMEQGVAPITLAEPNAVVAAVAEEKADAPEGGLKGDAPLKKKAAPKKKKADAAEATVVEAVALVVPETVAALIALESTVDKAQTEPIIVAAVVEAPKEKKKAAPKKKKAEAAVVEVAAVAAEPEPVIVAVAAATEEKAVVEAAPIKKKAAPRKKKADAPVVEVAAVVAVAAVPEEKADAPEGGLKGDAPLKKKAAPKKKADAARKVAAGKPDAVVEVPKAVVEAPKPAPKAVVEELSEEEVEEEEETEGGLTEVSPVGLKSVAPESDEESTDVKKWTWEVTGETYLKCCDNNCDILNCDCTGVVYSVHTQEPIGRWNGVLLEDNEDNEDDE